MSRRRHVIRGTGRLVIDATTGLTDAVEAMHGNVVRGPLSALVYRAIRAVAGVAGSGLDAILGDGDPHASSGDDPASLRHDALVAVVNGVVGDHLVANANPLAIPMRFRRDGRPLELTADALGATYPAATGKLLVLVHGSCMGDRQWLRRGHDHGQALAGDLGFTPIYLHFNSGLHVATNGASFAALLAALIAAWPVPVDDLVLLCHSMGGLVARSAMRLLPTLPIRRMVFLGTPHHGSPLERSGNIVTTVLGVSAYTGPIGRLSRLRSAGITDLRHGTIEAPAPRHDRFDHGPDRRRPTPLPAGVACYAIAASLASNRLIGPIGDGLVPVASALGHHANRALDLGIPAHRCHVAHGLGHLDLLDHAEVYAALVRFLSEET